VKGIRIGGRGLAALAAAAALLVFAAVALAVAPAPGTYNGKTRKQHRHVQVKVDDTGRVTFFEIRWKAKCKKKGRTWGPDGTQDVDGTSDPIKQDGTGNFHDSGSYDRTDTGGYHGHFKVSFKGKFTTPTKASGKFNVKVRVSRNGKYVDTCRKRKLKWRVHS